MIIQEFPKTELHLHIEGTFEPELVFEIAKRHNVAIPYRSVEEVRRAYDFHDLQSFLDIYYRAMSVLLHEEDFYDLTIAYLQRVSRQGVRHAEIFFDPQAHTSRGVSFETVVTGIHKALEEGERRLGISSKLIMCFLRDLSADSAMETLDAGLSFKNWIFAVGLDSKELGNPPEKFEAVFKKALDEGFMAVAHAGEEAPAEYIWQALELLGVSRIDHGYHCLEDARLVEKLASEQVPLTACPLAAVGVRYFDSVEHFPLGKMLQLGLLVMVNSDDPAYFGGYVEENLAAVQKAIRLNEQDILHLLKNSFKASFLEPERKQKFLRELDEKYASL